MKLFRGGEAPCLQEEIKDTLQYSAGSVRTIFTATSMGAMQVGGYMPEQMMVARESSCPLLSEKSSPMVGRERNNLGGPRNFVRDSKLTISFGHSVLSPTGMVLTVVFVLFGVRERV